MVFHVPSGVAPQTAGAFTVDRPLLPQLAAIGYTPADITYLALSHYHGDHVANASLFAGSTWIVQQGDRDAIFAPRADTKGTTGPNLDATKRLAQIVQLQQGLGDNLMGAVEKTTAIARTP